MKLRKCKDCNLYTMEDKCPSCRKKTSDAHYKFIRTPRISSDQS